MPTRQLLGLLGAVTLFLGVFAPIVIIPFVGSQSYFQYGERESLFLLLLALITAMASMRHNYRWLWLTGTTSLFVVLFTFVSLQVRMNQLSSDLRSEVGNNLFGALTELALRSIQFQWGWVLLILGGVLALVAATSRDKGFFIPGSPYATAPPSGGWAAQTRDHVEDEQQDEPWKDFVLDSDQRTGNRLAMKNLRE
jgi:hypothetical protein